jgi:3'-phosphoadenosine 5'-phosphosulfate (PAPS) 3'-phosphatase
MLSPLCSLLLLSPLLLPNSPGCYVALPKKDDGGGSIWDFAAIVCVFNEIGTPLAYCNVNPLLLNNKQTTFMNKKGVIFSSNTDIKQKIIKSLENS